jgi:hypothetical protein
VGRFQRSGMRYSSRIAFTCQSANELCSRNECSLLQYQHRIVLYLYVVTGMICRSAKGKLLWNGKFILNSNSGSSQYYLVQDENRLFAKRRVLVPEQQLVNRKCYHVYSKALIVVP